MTKTFGVLILAVGLGFSTFAAEASQNDMTVKVKGMVCAFCAQGVERKLKEHPEVKEVHVSLEKKEVHILFNDGKTLPKEKVAQAMKDAGYIADFGGQ